MQSADYQINNVLESYTTEKKIFVIGGRDSQLRQIFYYNCYNTLSSTSNDL